ncbi:hypothetical protein BGW39_004435, partial [Mortierella sp. 14UC]
MSHNSQLRQRPMEQATIRFFDMPELVGHLTQYLDRGDISRLMQTNQHLYALCIPAFYHFVHLDYGHVKLNNLFSSKESTL